MTVRERQWQILLIACLVAVTLLFGAFFLRELFPEYKVYQTAYQEIERFRSELTGQPLAPFKEEIKQIVLTQSDGGPETIDRCTSCHVALKLSHFSPTRLARDINGDLRLDDQGLPLQEENPDYIFRAIEGYAAAHPEDSKAQRLLTVTVDGREVSLKKVLGAHPLIGMEERPFEQHPMEEFGCTVCHSGNGRAITTERAHGPLYDGSYHTSDHGTKPTFLESDPRNDPPFAKLFNDKPGHKLLFQTTPILVGSLIEARCVQCHRPTSDTVNTANRELDELRRDVLQRIQTLNREYLRAVEEITTTLQLREQLKMSGFDATLEALKRRQMDLKLTDADRERASSQRLTLRAIADNAQGAIDELDVRLVSQLGSAELLQLFEKERTAAPNRDPQTALESLAQKVAPDSSPILMRRKRLDEAVKQLDLEESGEVSLLEKLRATSAMRTPISEIDLLTHHYRRGESLFLSQACYACHRVAGFARGGIGPELTEEGLVYPWFVKESMVWPQADLPTSTMPNYRLDHEELSDLMTYLLGQRGRKIRSSEIDRSIALKEWEEGAKLPFERPLLPSEQRNLEGALTIFATQGCAACHRLVGYTTQVALAGEEQPGSEAEKKSLKWFHETFPELVGGRDLPGSLIVKAIDENTATIDQRFVDSKTPGVLEALEREQPGLVSSFYSGFKYAFRAKNSAFAEQLAQATSEPERLAVQREREMWNRRVNAVLKIYVREYGLGRLVGPRPNWSGVYRDDAWLYHHFLNPGALVAKSIMPVLPFDKTKFHTLTWMLDVIGRRNTENLRKRWESEGFSPSAAYDLHCAQCHGYGMRLSMAPVAEWIYPVPKNLLSPDYLLQLGRKRAIDSIIHGVPGGPMPPWGELGKGKPFDHTTPVLTQQEIEQLVDWIFDQLPEQPGESDESEAPKWRYTPNDVLRELEREEKSLPLSSRPVALMGELKGAEKPSVTSLFTVRKNTKGEEAYDLNRSLYTPENLAEGERLFTEHCAICHGSSGGGNGPRAATMAEAKPRMLSHLPWIRERDDLRLLRSIKYGVKGTSMSAWGDSTSPLQRIQMLLYIRHLTDQAALRSAIESALYDTYEVAEQTISKQRQVFARDVLTAQNALDSAKNALADAEKGNSPNTLTDSWKSYQKAQEKLQTLKHTDEILSSLILLLRSENTEASALGQRLLMGDREGLWDPQFIEWIESQASRWEFASEGLALQDSPEERKSASERLKSLQLRYELALKGIDQLEAVTNGMLPSLERTEKLKELEQRRKVLAELIGEIQQRSAAIERLQTSEATLYQSFKASLEAQQ